MNFSYTKSDFELRIDLEESYNMVRSRLALVRGLLAIAIACAGVSCATSSEKPQSESFRATEAKETKKDGARQATARKPEIQQASLPPLPKTIEEPKVAFLADTNEGRSGAFKTLITVFARGVPRDCDDCHLLTVVYDGKHKGPQPLGAMRTSHARVDLSEACGKGAKGPDPKKLTTIGTQYHSPSEATFAFRMPSQVTCQEGGLVKVELLGLKCTNMNLQMCQQLEVRESLTFAYREMRRLLPLSHSEYPNRIDGESQGILQAKTH